MPERRAVVPSSERVQGRQTKNKTMTNTNTNTNMTTNTPQTQPSLFPIAFEIQADLSLHPDYEKILIKSNSRHYMHEPLLVSVNRISTGNYGGMESIIHLIRMNGIKLTVKNFHGIEKLRKIEVRVDILLGGLDDYQPSHEDLETVSNVVKKLVSPILLHPEESCLIMPNSGLVKTRKDRPCLTFIECRLHLNSVKLSRLRNLDHPAIKGGVPLQTKGCIQLGRVENEWILRLEETTESVSSSHNKKCLQHPLCVTLTLIGDRLRSILRRSGFSVFQSLTGADRIDLARVVKNEMSKLKGQILSVPQDDPNEELIVKFARIIALATKGDPSGRKALLRTAEEVFNNSPGDMSDSSFDGLSRLNRSVLIESSRIKSNKVSSLFTIDSITTRVAPWKFYLYVPVHDFISEEQGCFINEYCSYDRADYM
jgi:hypothetical protein